MDKLQIHTKGKGKGPVEIPETSSQFQLSSSQIQPENHRLDETLESSFARLSFADSDHHQNSNQILQNSDSILHNQSNQVINGGDVGGGYGIPHRRAIYGPQLMHDHCNNIVIGSSSNWNDSVSDSYVNPGEASSSVTHNNAFFNHYADSNHLQSLNPILHNHSNQVINGGARRTIYEPQQGYDHLPSSSIWNDSVNGSYVNPGEASTSVTHYPYPSMNSLLYRSSWDTPRNGFGSGINNYLRNNGSFGYNYDPSPSMNSQNRSMLSRAKHPLFSKQLQKMIAESPREVFDTIFKDLNDHVCDLMMDAVGDEVVQMLMVNCSSEQITMIVDAVTQNLPRFVDICVKPHGTRAIQLLMKCIRHRSRDQILRIVETVSRDVYRLARNNNSQSVIVKCFEEFTLSKCWTLLDAITQSCLWIAKDQNGCIMLQTLLRNYGELRQPLIPVIIDYALELCYDSYGNYLVQFLIIEMLDLHVAEHIMSQMRWNYTALSRNKYGSHVVQRLLQRKGIETTLVVLELLQHINILVVHEYANYVIQTAWDVSEEYMRGELWGHIQPNIPVMMCNKYGRKILERIQKSRA